MTETAYLLPKTLRRASLAAVVVFVGCATEHTVIVSNPPGARVTINNHHVGETPVPYSVHRKDWPDSNTFPCTLELEGYMPADCTFSGQRWEHIVGDIFTLGFIRIFRGPYGLRDEIRRDLRPITRPEHVDGELRPPAASGPFDYTSKPAASHRQRCTTEQVLSMKNSGLGDDQIRHACEDR